MNDPGAKARALREPWATDAGISLDTERVIDPATVLVAPAVLPGRPTHPLLAQPRELQHRSPFTPEGHAALIHAICHIEFNAIALALDAVWRFPGMPRAYYFDWLLVAREEAYHFTLLQEHLRAQGRDYGDFVAHDGLWTMCQRTAGDVVARMALVPRTLEARGLDASPVMQARLRKVGSPAALEAVDILDIILRDEIGHVAIGNQWYRWLCERDGLEPVEHYKKLVVTYDAPRMKPPFNNEARRKAGFTQAELDWLVG